MFTLMSYCLIFLPGIPVISLELALPYILRLATYMQVFANAHRLKLNELESSTLLIGADIAV